MLHLPSKPAIADLPIRTEKVNDPAARAGFCGASNADDLYGACLFFPSVGIEDKSPGKVLQTLTGVRYFDAVFRWAAG
jgi:hypothetical protein